MSGTEIKQKNGKKYECKICDYITDRKSNFDTHNLSAKHLKQANKQKFSNKFECEICDKMYQTSAGLWKHKQKCGTNNGEEIYDPSKSNEIEELKEFMKYLMKENSEMKNMMMKVIENGTHNILQIHTTNLLT